MARMLIEDQMLALDLMPQRLRVLGLKQASLDIQEGLPHSSYPP